MGVLIQNAYSSYQLNEDEQREGTLLTITQKQVLQNEIAIHAHELLAITYDPEKPDLSPLQQAYAKGKLDALTYRLECSLALENPEVVID